MKTLRTLLAGFALSALAWAQPDEGSVKSAIERLYARVDAAMAHQNSEELGRLLLPDAWLAVGPVHVSLLTWLNGAMKDPGRVSRSEVTDVVVSGSTAIASVRVHITNSLDRTKPETLMSFRDTWVRRGNGWALQESASLASHSQTPPTSAEAARPVVEELRAHASKLATAEAGHGLDDLKAFGDAVGDARIVALGEASHGTREFAQMKHRLLEYLVREKGFTVIAFEVDWPYCLPVDRYIQTGEGGLPRGLLPGFEEVRDMVEWMRAYNRDTAHGRLLTYTSFDMQTVPAPADAVLAYLRRYCPEDADGAEADYAAARKLAADRSNVFLAGAGEVAARAEALVKKFDAHRAEWSKASSPVEWRDARQAAAVVAQACGMRVAANGLGYRDRMMARNVEWLADEVHPGEKIVLWAHNGHVGFDPGNGQEKRMGAWLRERFGKDLYVVGFAFRKGEVRAVGLENGVNKGVGVWPVQSSPEGSGDAILSAAGMPIFFLNIAGLPHGGALATWLAQPHLFHEFGAVVPIGDPESGLDSGVLAKDFDGLVFFEDTHAIHPLRAPARQ
jgi:erythromycin esterase